MVDKNCANCKYWVPRYHGIGRCAKEGGVGSKFWVSGEDKPLLTQHDFGCVQFEEREPISKSTL